MMVTKHIRFCAAHRLYQYEGACSNIHGHNYTAEISLMGGLDKLGMVVDFGIIKDVVGGWIKTQWDHGVILNRKDTKALKALSSLKGQKIFVMDGNPTAENMAKHLIAIINDLMPDNSAKVRIWETEDSVAEAI